MIISADNRMIFESDYEVLYIKFGERVDIMELDIDTFNEMNFSDFVNDLVYAGYNNFELYSSLCNTGLFGKLCEVKNGYIVEEK